MTPSTTPTRSAPVEFSAPASFTRDVVAVVGAAVATGAAAGAAIGLATDAKVMALAGGAALLGGTLAAMMVRPTPSRMWLRALMGLVGGIGTGGLFITLAAGLGGTFGLLAAGAVGGLALGSLLTDRIGVAGKQRALGTGAAVVTGAVGGVALTYLQPFFTGEQMHLATMTGLMAGGYALWVSAAAGLARLQQRQDPLLARADALLRALADPMRTKLAEALASWNEVRTALDGAEGMADATRQEAATQADKLIEAVLETGHTWNQIEREVKQPRAQGIGARIAELQARADATTDTTTKGHLGRALSALHAQHGAVRGLEVAMERADAAVDAQVALLDRLRFAVAQHRVSDRERFHMELSAVAEEASRVSADLETLSTAMAEADRFSDQTALADFEASLRRSLGSSVEAPVEEAVARR